MDMQKEEKYFQISLAVDVVLFTIEDSGLKVLFIKRNSEPFKGLYSLPGGFVHEKETTKGAALRILEEKVGVKNIYIEQLYTFDNLNRDPRGQIFSVTYFAMATREEISWNKNAINQNPEFLGVRNLPKLAFDHSDIVKYSIKRLQAKLEYTNIVYSLLPKEFTLNQLQSTYEIILDKKLDKRNFQKKYLQLGLIIPTKKMLTGGRQRPARLYEFKSHKSEELRKFI